MKIEKILLAVVVLATMCLQSVAASTADDEVTARIKKVGSVCIQGDDCGLAAAPAVAAATGGGVEAHYKQSCSTCHSIGVAGAPVFGKRDDWEGRIAKGKDVLYASVLNGLAPGMPARGMCFTCSDDDLRAITDYMVAEASD